MTWMRPMVMCSNTVATTDRSRSSLPALLLGALVLLPGVAAAHDLSQDEALALTEQGRILPLPVFIEDALTRFPGRFLEAELELDDGRYIYELELVTRDRRVMELEYDAVSGELLGEQEPYDLAILDLGLPGMDGLEVLQRWRAAGSSLPVLILTARSRWTERVEGLQAGADDYLTKPFHNEELLLRVQALLRRAHGRVPQALLSVAGLQLDEAQQQVRVGDAEPLSLSASEFKLLRYFMLNPGKVLSKTQLAEHLYDYEDERDSNVIEVLINHLRRKLGREAIETRRGQGYVLVGRGE